MSKSNGGAPAISREISSLPRSTLAERAALSSCRAPDRLQGRQASCTDSQGSRRRSGEASRRPFRNISAPPSTLERSRLQNVPTRHQACVRSPLSCIFWARKLIFRPACFDARAGGRRRIDRPTAGFPPVSPSYYDLLYSQKPSRPGRRQTSRYEQERGRTSGSSRKLPAFRPKAVLPIPEGRPASAVAIRQVVRTFLGGARNTFLFHRISPSFLRSSYEPELASLLIAPR